MLRAMLALALVAAAVAVPPGPKGTLRWKRATPNTTSATASDWAYCTFAVENGMDGNGRACTPAWGDIPGSSCGGEKQSPIDIDTSTVVKTFSPPGPVFYGTACHHITLESARKIGNTAEITYDEQMCGSSRFGTSYTNFEGTSYTLEGVHFHTPSEHTINGATFDGEIHFVHKDRASGATMVVAVLLKADGVHPHPFINRLFKEAGFKDQLFTTGVNAYLEVLPHNHNVYHYEGSLTTPPCTEGVSWLVMAEHVSVTADDIQTIRDELKQGSRTVEDGSNARQPQDLGLPPRQIQLLSSPLLYHATAPRTTAANNFPTPLGTPTNPCTINPHAPGCEPAMPGALPNYGLEYGHVLAPIWMPWHWYTYVHCRPQWVDGKGWQVPTDCARAQGALPPQAAAAPAAEDQTAASK